MAVTRLGLGGSSAAYPAFQAKGAEVTWSATPAVIITVRTS